METPFQAMHDEDMRYNKNISKVIEKFGAIPKKESNEALADALRVIEDKLHEGKVNTQNMELLEKKVKILKSENKRLYVRIDEYANDKIIADLAIAKLVRENEALKAEQALWRRKLGGDPTKIWTNDGEL